MRPTAELLARAERWADADPDPNTQRELRALAAAGDGVELADRFAAALEFGTAGLRGVLGAGPNRMNRAVVIRTTWGFARHLVAAVPDARSRGVVVGYDGRRMSREFAEDAAAVLAAQGIRAILATEPIPTPLCSFAVAHLRAAAGVMVTASHNPPEYNGYKVYWENSAQIIPPVDAEIAACIDAAPPARDVPRAPLAGARAEGRLVDLEPAVSRAYLDAVRAQSLGADGDRTLAVVYTPLHGVGDKLFRLAAAEAGFTRVHTVPEQQAPDGAFPTVAFPNPEEKGAMDLAFALAARTKADLVLANDPDADRLSVAVPRGAGFAQLTGNQVGALLGHYLLTAGAQGDRRLVVASLVSSPLLGHIARALGVRYEETLTGFKWIANRAIDLEPEGYTFVFGFEEALGYTVGRTVRDKDGISAAVLAAELAAVLRARGETLLDRLEAIHREYGLFVSGQVNVTRKGVRGAEEIRALMAGLRASPPSSIGAWPVTAVSDYEAQVRTSGERKAPLALPRSNVLAYDLAGGSRVTARPSGTEPKVKFYFDLREEVRAGEALAVAEARAEEKLKMMTDAFVGLAGVA